MNHYILEVSIRRFRVHQRIADDSILFTDNMRCKWECTSSIEYRFRNVQVYVLRGYVLNSLMLSPLVENKHH